MSGWSKHQGRIAHLPVDNIDTDQLIPARFMSAPRDSGYGSFLLHDLQDESGDALVHAGDSILIAGRNFGSGSSREAAVYALVDFGFRAVFAPSFGDIFAANAINNGLLAATLEGGDPATLEGVGKIDLERSTLTCGASTFTFNLDPVWRTKLIRGWDDIDLTARHSRDIASFRARYVNAVPWAMPKQAKQ